MGAESIFWKGQEEPVRDQWPVCPYCEAVGTSMAQKAEQV